MNILRIICEEYQKFNQSLGLNELQDDWYDDEESIADKMYAQRFGMQNTKPTTAPLLTQGEYLGTFVKDSYPDTPIPVYKNPESLSGFQASVRAIVKNNGDLYITSDNKAYHEELLVFLAEKNIVKVNSNNLYYIPDSAPLDFIAVQRQGLTNRFEPSSLYDNILPIEQLDALANANEKLPYQFTVGDIEVMKNHYQEIYPYYYYLTKKK